jgi:hypothetical protein
VERARPGRRHPRGQAARRLAQVETSRSSERRAEVIDPAAIVLAAGASTRMGRPKALLLHDGRPFVRCVVDLAAGCAPILVVTGAVDLDLDLAPCDPHPQRRLAARTAEQPAARPRGARRTRRSAGAHRRPPAHPAEPPSRPCSPLSRAPPGASGSPRTPVAAATRSSTPRPCCRPCAPCPRTRAHAICSPATPTCAAASRSTTPRCSTTSTAPKTSPACARRSGVTRHQHPPAPSC